MRRIWTTIGAALLVFGTSFVAFAADDPKQGPTQGPVQGPKGGPVQGPVQAKGGPVQAKGGPVQGPVQKPTQGPKGHVQGPEQSPVQKGGKVGEGRRCAAQVNLGRVIRDHRHAGHRDRQRRRRRRDRFNQALELFFLSVAASILAPFSRSGRGRHR